jgi:hypothetical protein
MVPSRHIHTTARRNFAAPQILLRLLSPESSQNRGSIVVLESVSTQLSNPGRKFASIWFALAAIALAAAAYPLYVIRPFRHQGAGELSAALVVIHYRPYLEMGCAIAAVALTIWYFRLQRRWRFRLLASAATLAVLGIARASAINVYELMFHPLGEPTFSAAAKAKLDRDEQVFAVKIQGRARAYPIRSMSYHHIVNDTIAGEPIVATY